MEVSVYLPRIYYLHNFGFKNTSIYIEILIKTSLQPHQDQLNPFGMTGESNSSAVANILEIFNPPSPPQRSNFLFIKLDNAFFLLPSFLPASQLNGTFSTNTNTLSNNTLDHFHSPNQQQSSSTPRCLPTSLKRAPPATRAAHRPRVLLQMVRSSDFL